MDIDNVRKKYPSLESILLDKRIHIYVCQQLLDEIVAVVARPKISKYVSNNDINYTLGLIEKTCTFCETVPRTDCEIRDSNDLFLLSLADSVHADFIVTGDKDLLVLDKHRKTRIVNFKNFSDLIKY